MEHKASVEAEQIPVAAAAEGVKLAPSLESRCVPVFAQHRKLV